MIHKRTKACAIPTRVKKKVEERDGHRCIFCGAPGRGEAHVVPRSHGGLGIEQNLITVCRQCHFVMDDTVSRGVFVEMAAGYLKRIYPGWDPKDLVYKKGEKTKALPSWENINLVNNGKKYIENLKKGEKTKPPKGVKFFEN